MKALVTMSVSIARHHILNVVLFKLVIHTYIHNKLCMYVYFYCTIYFYYNSCVIHNTLMLHFFYNMTIFLDQIHTFNMEKYIELI